MLANVKALLPELTSAHAVVLEAPPMRIRTVGPEVAIVVQLARRRKAKTPLWVARWNELPRAPF
eukprot:7754552-Lingulodinium_polyedra.AAC.1